MEGGFLMEMMKILNINMNERNTKITIKDIKENQLEGNRFIRVGDDFGSDKKMIILLCGKKRVGKDTVADYLCKNYGFIKYSLADPMKKACKEIFMLDDAQLWGNNKEIIEPRLGITPRRLLQIFATELFQFDIYNHIPELLNKIPLRMLWIQRFKWWYENNKDKDIVISDGRFVHELEAIEEMDGFSIVVRRKQAEDLNESEHASEKEIEKMFDMVDFTIRNNSDFFDLYKRIDDFMYIVRFIDEKNRFYKGIE